MPRPRDPDLLRALGARLRAVRSAAGLSQEALAAAIDVAPNNVSNYETGKRALTVPALAAVSRALGVKLVDLVDVEAPVPATAPLSTGATELVRVFERLDERDRELVLEHARLVARLRRE
ncbi:MAG: helix-turn-helix transcriptional regulator [Pseudomonadota bacterium]|nr:helix-turn-helix transcriptional regulator [Pseudomonadota bacterium]